MPEVWVLIVYTLAVARLSGLATVDMITLPIREALVARVNPTRRAHRSIVYLLGGSDDNANGCPWCASIWIAAVAAPLAWWWGEHPALAVPAVALAMSQTTGMLSDLGRG